MDLMNHFRLADMRRVTTMKTGIAINWAITENAISPVNETSYNLPIATLPMNQEIP